MLAKEEKDKKAKKYPDTPRNPREQDPESDVQSVNILMESSMQDLQSSKVIPISMQISH